MVSPSTTAVEVNIGSNQKFPVILASEKRKISEMIIPNLAAASSQGGKEQTNSRRGRNVYSTQSQHHLPSTNTKQTKLKNAFEAGISHRATLK